MDIFMVKDSGYRHNSP